MDSALNLKLMKVLPFQKEKTLKPNKQNKAKHCRNNGR